MSTTIDSKVVEMRFDNKHFESNVQTSMSTLEKLKQKLNLSGASKGLENINTAAKNVNMSGLGAGVEAVQAKFSALQVIGVTALANITNSAVNAGKRIISALTIDPIKTGFSEYETQINATQTILANTQSKGSTIDDVNKALEELNAYADKTIYNFTEMTRNIGTFTAAGVDLETSVNAIQGIANLAAISGSTSQQASTAMYQLSQALSSGTVKLMDWNSVVNAGMGGQVFQDALKETARAHGIAIDAIIEKQGSFRESLSEGWLTSEILTDTLQKFTLATEGLTEAEIEANREMLRAKGYTEAQIDEIFKLGNTATNAATKVKTFSQLWEVLKESAQSGWSQTWKILVGDFEEAKNLLTPLADFFTNIINKTSEWRNRLLSVALDSPVGKIAKALGSVNDVADKVSNALLDLDELVNRVILGEFGNGQIRFDKLTEAGYNYYRVQSAVNEKLGDGFRYSEDVITSQDELLGITNKSTESLDKENDVREQSIELLKDMSDAQLKEIGITRDEIDVYEKLVNISKRTGIPIEEINGRLLLLESFKFIGQALVGVFKSVKTAWSNTFEAIKPVQLLNVIDGFYKFASSLGMVTLKVDENGNTVRQLRLFGDTANKLRRTFEGLFAALDIVLKLVGGPLKFAFKIITTVLGAFDLNILDVTASIGDAIVKFNNWLETAFDFEAIVKRAAEAVRDWFDAFKKSEGMQKASEYIQSITTGIKEWWEALKDAEDLPKYIAEGIVNFFSNIPTIIRNVGKYIKDALIESFGIDISGTPLDGFIGKLRYGVEIAGQVMLELGKILLEKLNSVLTKHGFQAISEDTISGFVNGLKNGATDVWNAALEIGRSVLESIREFLGIHSPSTETEELGKNTVDGFILGINNAGAGIGEAISGVFSKAIEFFKGRDFGGILVAVFTGTVVKKLLDSVDSITGVADKAITPVQKLGDVFAAMDEVLLSFSKKIKAEAFETRANAIKTLVTSLLLLLGAVIVIALIGPEKLWPAVLVIGALAVILVALWAATNLMAKSAAKISKDGLELTGFTSGIIGIATALLLVAAAVKMIGDMHTDELIQGMIGIVALLAIMGGVLIAYAALAKTGTAKHIDKAGETVMKLSVAMLLLVMVAKSIAKMSWGDMGKAAVGILGLVGIIALLVLISKMAGNKINSVGRTMLKISAAMFVLVIVAKLISTMSWDTMGKAAIGMLGLVGIITLLILITKIAGPHIGQVGGTILALSVAMGALTFVAIVLSMMSWGAMGKAAVGLVGLVGVVALLVLIVKMVKHDAPKIAGTILALSVSIALLGAVALLLGFIKLENLAKGVIAISILGAIMALMITATRGASDCHKNIMMMALAIGVMAVAIAALTFIKDTSKLAAATGALAIVMGMFALILKSGSNVTSSFDTLLTMVIAIGLIAASIYLLASLKDPDAALKSAAAMSAVMISLAGVMAAVSLVAKYAGDKALLSGLAALAAVVVALYAVVGALALMQNVQNATTNATVLGGLLAVLAIVAVLVAATGSIMAATMGWGLVLGLAALAGVLVVMAGIVGVLALMQNIQNAEANANLLTRLLTVMTAVMVVLAIVGPLATIGVAAMSGLAALIIAVGAFAVAVGALMTEYPQLEDFLNNGIPVMEKLAHGIGSMIGNFVAGFSEAIFATLPMLGECLSEFMTNAEVFIAGAKLVDDKVLAGVGILAAAIIALTVADLVAGVTSFLTMGSSFADLGSELSAFMTNAEAFIIGASAIDENMMNGVKALSDAVLTLTAANVIDGIASWFTGGSSLADFGAQLSTLGTNLNEFANNLGVFDESKVATVTCASDAIKVMASAAKELPNEGGVWAKLFGDNSLATFAGNLPAVATNLAAFANNLGTFDEAKMDTVTCAANAIKSMAEAASDIPNEGGVWAKLFGDNSIATFAGNLPAVATNLAAFANNLGTFDDSTVSTVTCAANAIVSMATAAEGIDGQAEWAKKLFGDNSLATFGEQLGSLGTNLAAFAKNLGTFTDDQVASISSAVSAIKAFATLGDINLGTMIDYLPSFGSVMVDLGEYLSDFCSNVSDIDSSSITTAVANMNKLIEMANSITGTNAESLLTFGEAVKKLGKCGIDNFVTEFTSSDSLTKAETAGEDLVASVIEGIEKKNSAIEDAGEDSGEEAVDGMDNFVDDAKQAGKDLGNGLIEGIQAKEDDAYDAGFALGQAAIKGEKDGQKSNSPSKLTILAGKWIGEGLVIGMGNMTRSVYNAGHDLGGTATDSISSTISKIADAVNTDLDVNPTIRPVLDLSDVESNAGLIGAMIGSDSLVGVSANVRAISATMNRRGQNGTNADVVSEIKKLRKGLDNVGNNVTNINGITYDDGSEVSNAVKVLVRAAKVERRR